MVIDTKFNVYSDARGGDPDSTSPTLRQYHKMLWSKSLPNGSSFDLHDNKNRVYLYHKSELGEFFLGAYTLFPSNKIDRKHSINQARGVERLIDDRFDLTLECIRLFYLGQQSPLYNTFLRYKNFFDLFNNFMGYVQFFLLDDLIDETQRVKFYLPFDNFQHPPTFFTIDDYLLYKKGVMNFIKSRNRRIEKQMTLFFR